jgi:hypothetical protein
VKNVCIDPLSWITKVAKGFRQSLVLSLGPGLRGEHGFATLAGEMLGTAVEPGTAQEVPGGESRLRLLSVLPVRGNLFRMTTVAEITGAVKRSP